MIKGFGAEQICNFTGLTSHELHLLAAGVNPSPQIPSLASNDLDMLPHNFAADVAAMAESSYLDHEEWGQDLGINPIPTPPKKDSIDSAETPYIYHDIAEKVSTMPPITVALLLGYLAGFWDGVGQNQ
jgi:hypothetical protein